VQADSFRFQKPTNAKPENLLGKFKRQQQNREKTIKSNFDTSWQSFKVEININKKWSPATIKKRGEIEKPDE